MPVFVALYRGINVGGKHLVRMETLRAMHERLGHQDVQSYIQSGNLVFQAPGSAAAVTGKVAVEFAAEFGFAARVIVVDAKRWEAIVADNPYAKFAAAKPPIVHLGICEGEPSAKELKALLTKTGGSESFVIATNVVYLHTPAGLGTSKFAAGMEKASGVPMTMRNWRTVEALWKLVGAANHR